MWGAAYDQLQIRDKNDDYWHLLMSWVMQTSCIKRMLQQALLLLSCVCGSSLLVIHKGRSCGSD